MAELSLVVGLGNPGAQYARTRHNAGFRVADENGPPPNAGFPTPQNQGGNAKIRLAGKDVLVAKPFTYMNESGRLVSSLARFFKIPAQNILVCFDDVSLGVGHIRLRPSGSAGGQKGMKSVIEQLGTQNIARLRVGIGPKPAPFDLADFVLSNFSKADETLLAPALENAANAVESWLKDGLEKTMTRFNG